MKRRAAIIPALSLQGLPSSSFFLLTSSVLRDHATEPNPSLPISLSTMSRILREPPLPTDEQTSPAASSDRWWPYSSSGDFGSSLSIVLVALICSLACGLAIHAVARFVVRWWKAAHDPSESTKPAASATAAIPASPALLYSSGMELAGATAECAICLTEFADGERVRVLPRCRHFFHVACVEAWLASHDSCPTCRGLCLAEKSPDKAPPLPAAAV